MNEIERRYELKCRELEVRAREKERALYAISTSKREVNSRYEKAKATFEELKKCLKRLKPGERPKAVLFTASSLSKELGDVKNEICCHTKELAELEIAKSTKQLELKSKKVALDLTTQKCKELKRENLERLSSLEQESVVEDLTSQKRLREGQREEGIIFSSLDLALHDEPRNQTFSQSHPQKNVDNASEEPKPQKLKSSDAPQKNIKQHTLCIETQSKNGGGPITINVGDRGALSVSVLTTSEREKASLLKDKGRLIRELSSLGVPLGSVTISKRRGRET